MTPITDMALPDEVVEKAAEAIESQFVPGAFAEDVLIDFKFPAQAAIRAALQAMLDNGMARKARLEISGSEWEAGSEWNDDEMHQAIIIRLDAERPSLIGMAGGGPMTSSTHWQRKRKEQA